MASPIYWLLAEPSWIYERRSADIIADLKTWNFDAQEEHGGVPMLRAFLAAGKMKSLPEGLALAIVKLLVEKGADPSLVICPNETPAVWSIAWGPMPAVRHFLKDAANGTASDPIGAELFGATRENGTPGQVMQQALAILQKRANPTDPIDGLHPGAWLLLHGVHFGDRLNGWCTPSGSDSSHIARVAIGCAKNILLNNQASKHDLFVGAIGLMASVDFCNNTAADSAAREAGLKLARKILGELDFDAQMQTFIETNNRPDQRSRMASALWKIAGMNIPSDNTVNWKVLFDTWKSMPPNSAAFEGERSKQLDHIGLPSFERIDLLPRTSEHQTLLLDILVAAFGRFSSFNVTSVLNERRLTYIDDIERWRADAQQLPAIDYDSLRGRMAYGLDQQVGANEALQSLAMRSSTQEAARGATPRSRL